MNSRRILFIDDEPNVLRSYERSLRSEIGHWSMVFETCPIAALELLQREPFDVVVSDVGMPGLSGIELLNLIKRNPETAEIAVLIVTGEADVSLKRSALDADAADLLNKPVNTDDLIARLRSVLRNKMLTERLRKHNEELETKVHERTAELVASQIDVLWRLGKAAEFRDEETGNHVIRVGGYSRAIAQAMGLEQEFTDTLFLSAPLHDIGKIGIPDAVLMKPGKLSDAEWTVMRQHCQIGASILSDECKFMHVARECSGFAKPTSEFMVKNPVIEMAVSIAASHHEKWNGGGYPNQLAGHEIPLVGRIVAVADVYDALRSRRPYKEPFDVARSREIIAEGSGSHFDPEVVEGFFDAYDQVARFEEEFSDAAEMPSPLIQTTQLLLGADVLVG